MPGSEEELETHRKKSWEAEVWFGGKQCQISESRERSQGAEAENIQGENDLKQGRKKDF